MKLFLKTIATLAVLGLIAFLFTALWDVLYVQWLLDQFEPTFELFDFTNPHLFKAVVAAFGALLIFWYLKSDQVIFAPSRRILAQMMVGLLLLGVVGQGIATAATWNHWFDQNGSPWLKYEFTDDNSVILYGPKRNNSPTTGETLKVLTPGMARGISLRRNKKFVEVRKPKVNEWFAIGTALPNLWYTERTDGLHFWNVPAKDDGSGREPKEVTRDLHDKYYSNPENVAQALEALEDGSGDIPKNLLLPTPIALEVIRPFRVPSNALNRSGSESEPYLRSTSSGYVNLKGEWVIPARWWRASPFAENLACVGYLRDGVRSNGFIDAKGAIVVPPQWEFAEDFSEGLAVVKDRETHKWGYVDKTGAYRIAPSFGFCYTFAEGLAAVDLDQDHWGFIDVRGRFVIQPNYSDASSFSGGFACVTDHGKTKYINKAGAALAGPVIEEGRSFSEGRAAVKSGGKWGYIDDSGKTVATFTWDQAGTFSHGFATVESKKGSS